MWLKARHGELNIGARLIQKVTDDGVREDIGSSVAAAGDSVFNDFYGADFLELFYNDFLDGTHLKECIFIGTNEDDCDFFTEEADVGVKEATAVELR